MNLVERLHETVVRSRRIRVIADALAELVARDARVLDVGAGDGQLAEALIARRRDLEVDAVDVLVRPDARVPVREFDGKRLPFADGAYDTALLVDVVHHAPDAQLLVNECARVAAHEIVLKDHLADGFLARPTLKFMDVVGNARHGVATPYSYLTRAEWNDVFGRAELRIDAWQSRLGLYPPPASFLFDRRLHFVARLVPTSGHDPDRLSGRQRQSVQRP